MTSANVNLSSVIAAQFLEQLSENERNNLVKEAIEEVLDGQKILDMIKELVIEIAREEVKNQIQGNTDIRAKTVSIINGAFQILLRDEEELKAKLAKGLIETLVKDRY
jgi:hypothetical protein